MALGGVGGLGVIDMKQHKTHNPDVTNSPKKLNSLPGIHQPSINLSTAIVYISTVRNTSTEFKNECPRTTAHFPLHESDVTTRNGYTIDFEFLNVVSLFFFLSAFNVWGHSDLDMSEGDP